jgi:hypothetical protein
MSFRIGEACALFLAMTLGACATTPAHVALSPKAEDNFASTEVVAPISQSEIYVYVPPTTAGQGNGLIGALIDAGVDSYRAGTAEKDVKTLRDAVVDMNFDTDMKNQLTDSLSKIAWLHVDKVRVIKELTRKMLDDTVTGSKDGAVMVAFSDYHLSNDGRQLFVVVNVDLYANSAAWAPFKLPGAKADAPSDPSNSLYRNSFTFQATLPGPPAKRDVNMAAWSANNGAAFRTAMKLAEEKLGQMIATDVQGGQFDASGPRDANGAQPSADSDGVVLRMADGTLTYSAN